MARKPSIGRQKIEIVKIPDKNHLQVTFSKRRAGLFKKASELCTLCAAEVIIVVFSPAEKVFSFGHPDVETLMDRFFCWTNAPPQQLMNLRKDVVVGGGGGGGAAMRLAEYRSSGAQELNVQLTHALGQLEAEKKRGEALAEALRGEAAAVLVGGGAVHELGLEELSQLGVHLEDLKKNVAKQASKLYASTNVNTAPFLGMNGIVGPMGMVNSLYESQPFEDLNAAAAAAALSRMHNYGYYNGDGFF